MLTRAVAAFLALSGSAFAQEPLSAIDWLGRDAAAPAIAPPVAAPAPEPRVTSEPPIATTATAPEVEVQELGAPIVSAVGLLPQNATGLPRSLWEDSDAARLTRLIRSADPAVPALSALLNTLMLAEADPPRDSDGFLAVRIARLVEDGALDAASALLERADPRRATLFPSWLDVSVLIGDANEACAALEANPNLTRDVASRVFCAARTGDWSRAAVALETGRALGELTPRDADLLERFLSPEMAEALPALPPPRDPSPLQFALYAAVGEPLPTSVLPRAFAVADLSGDNGWKAQLEAAERLARAGALSENRLLGIYTLREPAASGGVWDRVEALQDFESALATRDTNDIGEALLDVWTLMREHGLAVPFSRLFGQRLASLQLSGAAERIAAEAALLSDGYEEAARGLDPRSESMRALIAIAGGETDQISSDDPDVAAIAAGLGREAEAPDDILRLARADRLGEAILEAMALFRYGTEGNSDDLTGALAAFRALGLEDTARRSALQFLILGERRP